MLAVEMDGGGNGGMDGGGDGEGGVVPGEGGMGPDGGTGADAEPADVGMPDAGQPRCMMPACNLCEDLHVGALLCENFDDEPTLPWVPVVTSGGTTELVNTPSLAGGSSMRVVGPAGGQGRFRVRLGEAIETGEIHARIYAYLPSTTTIGDFGVLVNLSGIDSTDKLSVDINRQDAIQVIRSGGSNLGSGAGSFPRDRWTCVEFSYRIAEPGVEGLVSLSIDGRIRDFATPALTPAPTSGFSTIQVGVGAGPLSEDGVEVFVDEFVLSTESPVGCVP